MNNYSERAMRSKGNKVVKRVKKQYLIFYKLVSFILIVLTVFIFGMVIYNSVYNSKNINSSCSL